MNPMEFVGLLESLARRPKAERAEIPDEAMQSLADKMNGLKERYERLFTVFVDEDKP
jgi:hypothetical protein